MISRSWKALLPLLILLAAVAVVAAMMATSEPPARSEATEPAARLVRTTSVERGVHRINVEATGTVMPAESVSLQAQVSGRVVSVSGDLQPGAVVRKDDTLLRIEGTDFEAAVAEAEAQLAQARADLALERGRSEVAAAEFDSFADDLEMPVNEDLARRGPQLASAQAAVKRAEAQLARARANLRRTTLRAPLDALVLEESVDVGSQVGPQTQLARLVAIDRYWVRASLPIAHLAHVDVPGFNAETGSQVVIRQDSGAGNAAQREGTVMRLFGEVTPQGRLAQLLIRVPDPQALDAATGGPPLLLDAFVDVTIRGSRSHDAIRLPREHLHENDTVWVYADGRLEIRPVEIIWRAPEHLLIGKGLSEGERIVTSPLSNPVSGLRIKRPDDDDA